MLSTEARNETENPAGGSEGEVGAVEDGFYVFETGRIVVFFTGHHFGAFNLWRMAHDVAGENEPQRVGLGRKQSWK